MRIGGSSRHQTDNDPLGYAPERKERKSFVARLFKFGWIMFVIGVLVALGLAVDLILRTQALANQPLPQSVLEQQPLTVSPVNPHALSTVTRLRSCIRYDDSGSAVDGEQEFQRNMAHIVSPVPELRNVDRAIPIVAPFDGIVAAVHSQSVIVQALDLFGWTAPPTSRWANDTVLVTASDDPSWRFKAGRIERASGISVGNHVAAGDTLGYIEPTSASADLKLNYANVLPLEWVRARITSTEALLAPRDRGHVVLFDHLADDQRQLWEDAGFILDDLAIPRDARDQQPCPDGMYFDAHTYVPEGRYDECASWRHFHRGTLARTGFDVYGNAVGTTMQREARNHPCAASNAYLTDDEVEPVESGLDFGQGS